VSTTNRSLIVFAHERSDARVVKRVRAFTDLGWKVTGFTFHRSRPGRTESPCFSNVNLGETHDRAYARRGLALIRALRILWRERTTLHAATALYAINTDNALLGLAARVLANRRLPLFLEIADIQPPFTTPGVRGRVLRWIERRVLARTTCLVTTSPAFLREYFTLHQGYTGRVFLLENKVYPSRGLARPASAHAPPAPPWRIGWFGALRCQATWEAMRTLARRHPTTLHFVVRGYPTAIDAGRFLSEVGDHPNVEFGGAYRYPDDLATMHSGLHFVWGFDFSDPTANSRWLLPNRLYESGLFHIPLLAAANTETGRRVAADRTGPILDVDADTLADAISAFFESLTSETWQQWRTALEAQPASACAGDADYASLSEAIAEATDPPHPAGPSGP
jgi:succinoglycan biosynthesis protein ExoL